MVEHWKLLPYSNTPLLPYSITPIFQGSDETRKSPITRQLIFGTHVWSYRLPFQTASEGARLLFGFHRNGQFGRIVTEREIVFKDRKR